ncbi:MAG: PAS domain-containing protein [Bacteroidetes bacterium]|nr:PAS domain-containing protein [Bacteroidota bacterium]
MACLTILLSGTVFEPVHSTTPWRDIWLIAISFLMFLGTIYIYFKLRTSTFRRVRRLLEERVEIKTKQLSEKNFELEKLSLVASKTDNAVMVADAAGKIYWVNDAFSRIIGSGNEIIGKNVSEIQVYQNVREVIAEAVREKRSKIFESNIHSAHNPDLWISSTLTPIFDERNNLKELVFVDTDITASKILENKIKASLHDKDILLKEIHHRVKNNLQIIISLLNLQSGYIKDEQTLKAVKDGQNRVRSMALVHEKFYQADELTEINFREYVEKLNQFLFQSYGDKTDRVKLVIEADDVAFDMDTAMPCGLLINEIVSNSLKYAFPGDRTGEIKIELKKLPEQKIRMSISDDGAGLPENFDVEHAESLGMQLITALANQLDGELQVSREKGTKFSVFFKYPKAAST